MFFLHTQKNRAFTLIELLLVISMVSLLSSIVYAQATEGRVKAQDAKKVAEADQVGTALRLYTEDNGQGPTNYHPQGKIAVQGEEGGYYEQSMQDLVDAGYLGAVPTSSDPDTPYVYYDFGAGTDAGALFGTSLSSGEETTTGKSGSCRPFGSNGELALSSDLNQENDNSSQLAVIGGPQIGWPPPRLNELYVTPSPELIGCWYGPEAVFPLTGQPVPRPLSNLIEVSNLSFASCIFEFGDESRCVSDYIQVIGNQPYGTCTPPEVLESVEETFICDGTLSRDHCVCTSY